MTGKDELDKQTLELDVLSSDEHDADEEMNSMHDLYESSSSSSDENDGDEEMDSMHDLYEQSFRNIQEGEVIRGHIVQVSEDFVMVDIGYKSEGQISIHEFRDESGIVQAEVGDEIDVLLEYHDDDDGTIHLSKEKAAKIKVWDDISRIYSDDGMIEGKISRKSQGRAGRRHRSAGLSTRLSG